jgi:hypothetical protein
MQGGHDLLGVLCGWSGAVRLACRTVAVQPDTNVAAHDGHQRRADARTYEADDPHSPIRLARAVGDPVVRARFKPWPRHAALQACLSGATPTAQGVFGALAARALLTLYCATVGLARTNGVEHPRVVVGATLQRPRLLLSARHTRPRAARYPAPHAVLLVKARATPHVARAAAHTQTLVMAQQTRGGCTTTNLSVSSKYARHKSITETRKPVRARETRDRMSERHNKRLGARLRAACM